MDVFWLPSALPNPCTLPASLAWHLTIVFMAWGGGAALLDNDQWKACTDRYRGSDIHHQKLPPFLGTSHPQRTLTATWEPSQEGKLSTLGLDSSLCHPFYSIFHHF